nr:hypothetical protein GCM10020093_109530 [Planobispora longispora]
MLDMEYSKAFRMFLFIPGAQTVWLVVGIVFVASEVAGDPIPMKNGSALAMGLVGCGIGGIAVVATVVLALSFRRKDRRRRFLLAHGLRARGWSPRSPPRRAGSTGGG